MVATRERDGSWRRSGRRAFHFIPDLTLVCHRLTWESIFDQRPLMRSSWPAVPGVSAVSNRWFGSVLGLSKKGCILDPQRAAEEQFRLIVVWLVIVSRRYPLTCPKRGKSQSHLLRLHGDDGHVKHTLESQASLGEASSPGVPQG